LGEPDPAVVKAAARALGRCGPIDDLASLERLLAAADREVRVEAAAALARLGSPRGPAALDRLARDRETHVRRKAAEAMGQLKDSLYLPTLIRLLDDQTSVQRASLQALPQVVGRDVCAEQTPPLTTRKQRAEFWKNWYRRADLARRPL
jgi:HEAT repeat protein